MLKRKYISIVCLLGLVFFSFLNFEATSESQLADVDSKKLYKKFFDQAQLLTQTSEAYHAQKTDVSALRNVLSKTRLAYKEIEFLLEYYYPSFVEENLNGAPLYHAEKYGTHPNVLPPEGLQVLDEIIFSEEADVQKSEIAILCKTLENKSLEIRSEFTNRPFLLAEVIEACKMELIRIFSMGLTGFDTPGSVNAIPEAISAMHSMQMVLDKQTGLVKRKLVRDIQSSFNEAIQYLNEHNNFDSFDHLYFLKNYINPLYSKLGRLQQKEDLAPSVLFPTGRNTVSDNIFNADFLKPYFFTELKASEDSPALKLLGESLFYDKSLSNTGEMSCGTCHQPELAFSDGLKKSESNIKGETVMRNAPTLLNAVYADRYFYDMRAFTLEQQAEHVIFNHAEFNTAYDVILQKLNSDEDYVQQFEAIFGTQNIDRNSFSKALASYVLSLQSFNSPFDQYIRKERKDLPKDVKLGFNLFMGKAACATCHFPPVFSGLMPPYYSKNESEILGVLQNPFALKKEIDADSGRINNGLHYENTWIYEKSFKTPTIRNIEKTAPYFHNGAYPSLELVVGFYDHGGGAGLGLEVKNQTLASDPLNLSQEEKDALVAFMKSLTDVDD